MTLGQLYNRIIATGIANDPRGAAAVRAILAEEKKASKTMSSAEIKYYDHERTVNPYADTRIYFGDSETAISHIMAGIDVDTAELLLVDRLRQQGKRCDAVLAHHPTGRGYAELHDVMQMQADVLALRGVPIHVAEDLMADRIKEVRQRIKSANHFRTIDAARILGIPLLNAHTPSDNCVATYLTGLMNARKPRTLSAVVDILREIPEYHHASLRGDAPQIITGSEKRKAGRALVDMTGGTEGSTQIFDALTNAGISTIIGMHFSDKHIESAQKAHLNLIVAGHIASDNLGMNLMLDKIITKGENVAITAFSGFERIRRR